MMITETPQAGSRFHIETDEGEFWALFRDEAITFAKQHEYAEVWDTETEERIYWAEA